MKKRIISLLIISTMILTLVACSKDEPTKTVTNNTVTNVPTVTEEVKPTEETKPTEVIDNNAEVTPTDTVDVIDETCVEPGETNEVPEEFDMGDGEDIRDEAIAEKIKNYCSEDNMENNLENMFLFRTKANIAETVAYEFKQECADIGDYPYEEIIVSYLDKLYPLTEEEQAKKLIEFYTYIGCSEEQLKNVFMENDLPVELIDTVGVDFKDSLVRLIQGLQAEEMYGSSKVAFYNMLVDKGWLDNISEEELKSILNDTFVERTDDELRKYYETHPNYCGGKSVDDIIKEYHEN